MEDQKPKQLPCIKIGWDAAEQNVVVQADPAEFRSPYFVLGLLEMARAAVEAQARIMTIQAMQKQQAEAAQAEAIRRKLGV